MKGRSYQPNFTMGELSDDLYGRVDLSAYTAGAGLLQNFLPAATGPARRRAGFLDEGAPKHQDKAARLSPFQRSLADRLMLEFGDDYLRFFNPDGSPVLNGAVPYEIVSPYGEADLEGIRFIQSNDVMFFVHTSCMIKQQVLKRTAALNWSFAALPNENGPWREENTDETLTIEVDHLSGVIEGGVIMPGSQVRLIANHNRFDPAHVGSLWRLRASTGNPSVTSWAPDVDANVGYVFLSDGKVYRADSNDGGNKTGRTPPIHDRGISYDGRVWWKYLHDGAGVIEITGYTSATTVTGTVKASIPLDDGQATPFWTEGAWSNYRGWPRAIAETDEQRLAFGGCLAEPGLLALTRVNGYSPTKIDFKPGLGSGRVVDDDGIRRTIAAGGDPIEWLLGATYLMIGTSSREYVFAGSTLDDALSPAGSRSKRLSKVGSRDVQPVEAHDGVIFVPRGGRGLRMTKLSADQVFGSQDLALFAERLTGERLKEFAWAPHPYNTLWIRTDAGSLLSVVYHPEQRVFGWQRHPLGGGFKVESLAVLSDDEGFDTLWMVVYRQKDGVTQRRIWRQAQPWRAGDHTDAMIYLDAAKIYDGAAVTAIAGLGHLEGETVRVLGRKANGELHVQSAVVDGGAVELAVAVVHAVIGLKYVSELESLPLDIAGPAGTLGQQQRVTHALLYLADYIAAEAAFGDGPLEVVGGQAWAGEREPQTLYHRTVVGNVTTRKAKVRVRADDVWPLTVLAVGAEAAAHD